MWRLPQALLIPYISDLNITSHLIFYHQSVFIKSTKVKGSSIGKNILTKKKVNGSQGQTGPAALSERRAWTVPYGGAESLAPSSPHSTWLPRWRGRRHGFQRQVWGTLGPTACPWPRLLTVVNVERPAVQVNPFFPARLVSGQERHRRETLAGSSKIKGRR